MSEISLKCTVHGTLSTVVVNNTPLPKSAKGGLYSGMGNCQARHILREVNSLIVRQSTRFMPSATTETGCGTIVWVPGYTARCCWRSRLRFPWEVFRAFPGTDAEKWCEFARHLRLKLLTSRYRCSPLVLSSTDTAGSGYPSP